MWPPGMMWGAEVVTTGDTMESTLHGGRVMALDLNKLEQVRRSANGKITARCPACAAVGGDRGGQHLVVFQDGRFGCVANPKNHTHRREIHRLCGVARGFTPKAIPIRRKNSLRGVADVSDAGNRPAARKCVWSGG